MVERSVSGHMKTIKRRVAGFLIKKQINLIVIDVGIVLLDDDL
jgi:hypothetical protein